MGQDIKRIIVAGSSGFMGGYLVETLQESGYEVLCFDRKDKNTKKIIPEQDALNLNALNDYITKNGGDIDLIINLMRYQDAHGKGGRDTGKTDPHPCIFENCTTALNVCEAARRQKIENIIYFSSCAVYGTNSKELIETTKTNPSDAYAASKIAAENIVKVYSEREKNNRSIIIRPTVIVGEKQSQRNIFQDFFDCALKGRPLIIYHSRGVDKGTHMRELVHAKDACEAILRIAQEHIYSMKKNCDVFVLGSKKNRINMNDLADKIVQRIGGKSKKQYTDGAVYNQITNCKKIESVLRWETTVGVEKIIDDIAIEHGK